MARTKQQLRVDNNTSFPNNNTNYITPAILREYNSNVIDSLVDEIPFGEYTQSVDTSIENLNNFTASLQSGFVTTGSFNSYTSSNDAKWNTLGGQTGSYLSTTATGSLLVTASASSNVITFTKGNGDTFNVTVADTTDLSSLNAFTASATISLNALNVSSASQQVSINALNAYTASASTASIVSSITQLNAATASLQAFSASQLSKDATLATYTGSNDTKWSNLGAQSGSWITESETGSFATTGSNTFIGNQTISGSLFQSGSLVQNGTSELSGTVNITGSTTIKGTTRFENSSTTITGSLLISGSTTQIGNNLLNGTTTLSGSVFVSGNIEVTNGANLITHNVKAAGSNGLDLLANNGTTIATMGAGGSNQAAFTGQLTANTLSASVLTGLGSPIGFSSSVAGQFAGIASQSGSWITESETGSFAKLDASQIFTGNNTFTGNTVVSQSATFGSSSFYSPMNIQGGIVGDVDVTGSLVATKVGAYDFDSLYYGSQLGGTIANGTFFGYGSTDYTFTLGAYAGGFDNELQTFVDSTGIYLKDFNGSGYNTFLKLNPNAGTNPAPILTRGVEITGSTKLTPDSVSTNAQFVIPFISASVISKDSVDTLFYNPSTNQLQVSASTAVSSIGTSTITVISGSGNGQYASAISKNAFTNNSGGRYIAMSGWPFQLAAPSLANSNNPAILAMSSSGQPYTAIELQHSASFTDGRVTVMKPLVALQNLEVTGSLTASLQSGYTWVGDGNNKTTLLSTSSFATTLGSNTFYGDQTISGSLYVSGAVTLFADGANGFTFAGKSLFLTNSVQTGITHASPVSYYQNANGNMYIQNNVSGVGSGSMNIIAANNANLNISSSNFISTAGQTTINSGDLQVGKDPTADIYNGFKVDRNGADGNNYAIYNLATSSAILDLGAVDGTGFSYSTELFVQATPTSVTFSDFSIGDYGYHSWMKIPQNTGSNPKPIMTRGLEVTGSVDITGSLRATGELKFSVGGDKPFGTVDASDQPYTLNNSLIHSNSIIMLTLKTFTGGGTEPTLYIAGQNEGSASIGFTNDSAAFSFNYMIINPA